MSSLESKKHDSIKALMNSISPIDRVKLMINMLNDTYLEEWGITNPLSKGKWRETLIADNLGHVVHKKTSGGKGSKFYGSDAMDPNTGEYWEYKSVMVKHLDGNQMREKQWNSGKLGVTLSGVYNGAYNRDALEKYSEINHALCLYSERSGDILAIVQMHTSHVISQLTPMVESIEAGTWVNKKGKPKTTNCNNVGIKFKNSVPLPEHGEIIWTP